MKIIWKKRNTGWYTPIRWIHKGLRPPKRQPGHRHRAALPPHQEIEGNRGRQRQPHIEPDCRFPCVATADADDMTSL
jgi:hypothetical protein